MCLMNGRFLDSAGPALLLLLAAAPGAARGAAPPCYADVDAYMVATYGEPFHADDNLHVSGKTYGKTRFSLVEDVTSGSNHARVLLRARGNKEVCVVLATPPVVQLDVVKLDAAGIPVEFRAANQAPPGSAGTEISYRLAGDMFYVAAACTSVTWQGRRATRKAVACATQ